MMTEHFLPLIRDWFGSRFDAPTEPQRLGWPVIAARRNTLIAAPTGSGKTLAAFLVCLNQLWEEWMAGRWQEGIQVVYVSPLKALSNDIERNLQTPLAEISELAVQRGLPPAPIRVAVRTGDTSSSERQAMLRRPPHILVTTPESLYLLLTSARGREPLRRAHTFIVDEIHAVARDKRGSHLALSAERLEHLAEKRPVRIGLSATQRPLEQIAAFLGGSECRRIQVIRDGQNGVAAAETRNVADAHDITVIDAGHVRDLDLAVEVPPSELSSVCSNEQWGEVYHRLTELVESHRSTLIFVNTRRFAERVTHRLTETLGEGHVASHHGSLSREIRHSAEQRLKRGDLKAIIATASLEMGIDIGHIDLVCQIGSPRSIATFLQRVGRSGHSLRETPKGRLFPLTRDELLECMALNRAVRSGVLDAIEIPQAPLDILAQQIVAAVAVEEWDEAGLFELFRRAWPYRNLSRNTFDEVVRLVSDGMTPTNRRGAYLHHDRIQERLRPRRGARLAAVTSGGAIPEMAEYRVVAEPDEVFVGTVDEHFAIESHVGDVFLLGNTSWRIQQVRGSQVVVRDAQGAPPSIPFWFGEAPGRTIELSEQVSELRLELTKRIESQVACETPAADLVSEWCRQACGTDDWGTHQALSYVASQLAALGVMPTGKQIVFERFFDESGGMQLVIHAPLGTRINRAWGLSLRKRFCRSFDFELQAAATDNGILLSIGPQHSFPIDSLFKMLGPHNARYLLEQVTIAAPMFQVRWRWNVTRALAVLRNQTGKRVPPHLQRLRSDDLLAAAFPETVGCLENHHGDVEIPSHPLVQQTMYDCLHEAMDVDRWIDMLGQVSAGEIVFVARDTREPSPFTYELLNANPYAFLDDAPLEERRTRAIQTRRSLTPQDVQDLARLDPLAIEQVTREAWPIARDADELHDALQLAVAMPPSTDSDWRQWFEELKSNGRAVEVRRHGVTRWWISSELWPVLQAIHPDAEPSPPLQLPDRLNCEVERSEALKQVVRGRMQFAGPCTAAWLAGQLDVEPSQVSAALESLEGQGILLRGAFRSPAREETEAPDWCDRRLLARIHRLTMEGLRRRIQPVSPADFLRFLARHHRLAGTRVWAGSLGLREALLQLQGFDMPAGAWERCLSMRMDQYDEQWLDHLFLSGEVMWGRLRVPRRSDEKPSPAGAWNRTVPISLMRREDLSWLLDATEVSLPALTDDARRVRELLEQRGALFFQEISTQTSLSAESLEEALRELAALGLVSSDMFAAVRALVQKPPPMSRKARHGSRLAVPTGRWSPFPGAGVAMKSDDSASSPMEDRVLAWCHQLLKRYGVLFRDVCLRETAAPAWSELVRSLRRLELKGEVRGGRFVEGVSGEQYADPNAVELLREVRESAADEWVLISAADPLNLSGLVGGGQRVPATHRNFVVLHKGQWTAARIAGRIEFWQEPDDDVAAEVKRALETGYARRCAPVRKDGLSTSQTPSSEASAGPGSADGPSEALPVATTASLRRSTRFRALK